MARRKARTTQTLALSGTYIEAEEAHIEACILVWVPEYEALITAEESHRLFAADFLRRLQTGGGTLSRDSIIALAKNGHPPAAAALEAFIDQAMDENQFDKLPVSVRAYAREVWGHRRPRLPLRYPSTCWQGLNFFKRDVLIEKLINRICERWTQVPPLYPKGGRRSAADLVGKCLGLSESTTRRAYLARREFAETFIRLLNTYQPLPSP